MRSLRHVFAIVSIAVSVVAGAETLRPAEIKASADLERLQGKWEGVQVGSEDKITVTIRGNTLHFHRDAEFWFETAITLPEGKDPKQLHATINACPESQKDSRGELVRAFFKIEDGTLTLATMGEGAEETAEAFADAGTRYELLRVQPKKQDAERSESN